MDHRYFDRKEAGEVLAKSLLHYKGVNGIVLGLPRGGVIPAAIVAKALKLPLDVLVVRKVGEPFNPEFAIGALTSSGEVYLNLLLIQNLGIFPEELKRLIAKEKESALTREKLFRSGKEPLNLAGKVVILVDDGLATGSTMRVAIQEALAKKAAKIVVAVPVGSSDSTEELRSLVDELVCPLIPIDFHAVGQFYTHFNQVEDSEVVDLLSIH